jgi:hypothetical protein
MQTVDCLRFLAVCTTQCHKAKNFTMLKFTFEEARGTPDAALDLEVSLSDGGDLCEGGGGGGGLTEANNDFATICASSIVPVSTISANISKLDCNNLIF